MQPIVVYDTNVLISGMIWGGIPYDCIALAQEEKVEGLICEEILDNRMCFGRKRHSYYNRR
jgi:predicted nucleic acid-binding protein